jgi:hypothetical protein
VLKGRARRRDINRAAVDAGALWSRLDSLEGRVDEIAKLISDLKADVARVIELVRCDGVSLRKCCDGGCGALRGRRLRHAGRGA